MRGRARLAVARASGADVDEARTEARKRIGDQRSPRAGVM
jgi:hypothetical protein